MKARRMGMRKINGEFWLCIGSQDLYGDAVLENVKKNGEAMVAELNASGKLDYKIVLKPVLITSSLIKKTFEDANRDENCLGVITWMHTFSPSKSWIPGLKLLTKPLLHFHTQFRKEIPYDTIDMDYMNENQSAHGDREYAFALSRLRMPRGIVIGHYQDERVQGEINSWMKAAAGIVESSRLRILRIADNMRNVAVTEGDKVEAAYKLGWEVDTYPVNDIVKYVDAVSEAEVNTLTEQLCDQYEIIADGRDLAEFKKHIAVQAGIEIGFERFLEEKNYQAIVTHFDDLGGLKQLPGMAIQRLMEKGYGFGAEGDWKTAGMVRLMKAMAPTGLGTSFMEDYTYNLIPGKEGILEAHMLEVCPSVSGSAVKMRCLPLSMGNREDPVRLIFTAKDGDGVAASLVDMGGRMRLIISEVNCRQTEKPMPMLPVATSYWVPKPDFYTGIEAWLLAGGAHHTAFSYDITSAELATWAEHFGIEAVIIDDKTDIRSFKRDLAMGDVIFGR